MPDDDFDKSKSLATVSLVAHGNVAAITYAWMKDGQPQEGVLLVTNAHETSSVVAVWVDSWHQAPQWMELEGVIDKKGLMHFEANYADGSWWIHVDPRGCYELLTWR